ncbi:hypothetical protein [Citrobacter freundii]|uniref:hypothetical protein n=1 Tax=Citrobacter freundii TaxID=546 RepID=UPI003978E3E7
MKTLNKQALSSHPAHGPVSLDRLHQIREILSKAAAQRDGGNLGYAMADAVKVIDGAIVSFGAEPVAWRWRKDESCEWHLTKHSDVAGQVEPLYTSPQPLIDSEQAEPVYQYREIGGGVWEVCGKDWFDHCSQSPEHDTRTLYAAMPAYVATPAPVVAQNHHKWSPGLVHPEDCQCGDCCAAMLQAGNSPVTPDGLALAPKRLTAENGAKGVLSGEFSETKFINCPECFGDDECETCDGSGRIEITVPVSWTNIKAIWAKGVEHFEAAPQQENI